MDKEKEWALIIEQANIDLKLTLKTALTSFLLKEVTKTNALKIIDDTINALKSKQAPKELIERTKNSLKNRFVEWYRLITTYLQKNLQKQDNPLIRQSYTTFTGEKLKQTKGLTIEYDGYEEGSIPNIEEYMTTGRTAGAQSFMDGYVSVVKRTMTSIANKNLVIKDKNGRKMSLRGLAEMTARFEDTRDKLAKLKDAGIKYVLASSHSNASERCQIWQGKLFELDCDINATYKQEVDLSYVPTPKGKIDGLDYYSLMDAMHHGFLGYNCRHRLIKYTKGMDLFISYDANTIAKERGLEQKQRYLERQIRKYKEKTILSVDPKERKTYQEKSKLYQQKYAEFCKAKGLVRYDWRTRITREEKILTTAKKNGTIPLKKILAKDLPPPIDDYTFKHIKKQMKAIKVKIIQEKEMDWYLDKIGAEAAVGSDGRSIVVRTGRNPSASAIYEEIIHINQIRHKGKIMGYDPKNLLEIYLREIKAKEHLLAHAKEYKLAELDIKQTKEALEYYRKKVKEHEGR